jgi:hypothetical protein
VQRIPSPDRSPRETIINFDWTPEQQAYRSEGVASKAQIDYSKIFRAKMSERGLRVHHWPQQYGSNDGNAWEHFVLDCTVERLHA